MKRLKVLDVSTFKTALSPTSCLQRQAASARRTCTSGQRTGASGLSPDPKLT